MVSGILSGFISAILMSGSYIFSRTYLRKYQDPVKLAVFSQINMGILGIFLLGLSFFCVEVDVPGRVYVYMTGETFSFLIAQTSFFLMLRKVEATRVASLLGLKLVVVALFTVLLGNHLFHLQWLAIILCTIAAVGMNFSGGKIPLSSVFWLIMAVSFYAFCDICITGMMQIMPGKSMLLNSFFVMGCTFTGIGVLVLPGLFKYPLTLSALKATIPYTLFYFSSMIFLMTCFGLIGVVFGSIIQATRGVISVVLGMILLHFGLEKNEPQVPVRIWIRRIVMSILMFFAIILYTLVIQ